MRPHYSFVEQIYDMLVEEDERLFELEEDEFCPAAHGRDLCCLLDSRRDPDAQIIFFVTLAQTSQSAVA